MVLNENVVGLHTLQPRAEAQQVSSMRKGDLIVAGEQIAHRRQIAAGVCAAVGDLRCAVQSGAAADHYRAHRLPCMDPARQIDGRSAVEIKCSAREAERGAVDHTREKRREFRSGSSPARGGKRQ